MKGKRKQISREKQGEKEKGKRSRKKQDRIRDERGSRGIKRRQGIVQTPKTENGFV